MKTAVVTDGKYRASLAAVRALGAAGFRVVVTQTKGEAAAAPASFLSRYAAETRWIDGSCKDDAYGQNLLALLGEYDTPVLFRGRYLEPGQPPAGGICRRGPVPCGPAAGVG